MSESALPHGGLGRSVEGLDRLHPGAIRDVSGIRALLEHLHRDAVPLRRGMNRRIAPEIAQIERIEPDGLVLRTQNFERDAVDIVFLNFALDGQPYFFSAPFEAGLENDRIRTRLPQAIYQAERRDRMRRAPESGDPRRVALGGSRAQGTEALVTDTSPDGLAICVADEAAAGLGENVHVRFLDGANAGTEKEGAVRHREPMPERRGWTRIGLDLSPVRADAPFHIERRDRVMETTATQRAQRRWRVVSAAARVATDRALSALGRRTTLPTVRIVDYANDAGENIRAVVDSWGDTRGATAVVIPPAWGRTKETLMPLAATLVAGFRAAGEPIVVVRFDGIRKRGESHNDPECRAPGREHHRFTFSQGARDIQTTLDFLERSPEFRPRKTILVSFSAASIESRRAVATDPRIHGWVCVVGAADTQSMMRVISGGVDYVAGVERGVRFGLQEVLGVEVDIDHAGADLSLHRLPHLDDARRDFEEICVPVTWIHGEHDAWMDRHRIEDVLSRGDTSHRRFIQVPTGHMLKTSREALETFQLIASEVGTIALGRAIPPALPDLGMLDRRQRAERRRLPAQDQGTLKDFWKSYLVGRDGTLGIELMTHTSSYQELMEAQVRALRLGSDDTVVDLGAGTGAFPVHLARSGSAPGGLHVLELDYVRDGFERARIRLADQDPGAPEVSFVESNLDLRRGGAIPLVSSGVEAVLGGFFLSYVEDPVFLLREIKRILKPGGRLVLSCLRRDADISRLFTRGLEELRATSPDLRIEGSSIDIDAAARDYLNRASRLLDLEESGRFHFWEPDELREIVRRAGFLKVTVERSFGDPPQAVLLSAIRR